MLSSCSRVSSIFKQYHTRAILSCGINTNKSLSNIEWKTRRCNHSTPLTNEHTEELEKNNKQRINLIDKEEEEFRRIFATDKLKSSKLDSCIHLINVFNNIESFKYQKLTKEEESIPSLLSTYKEQGNEGELAISSKEQFISKWNDLTSNHT